MGDVGRGSFRPGLAPTSSSSPTSSLTSLAAGVGGGIGGSRLVPLETEFPLADEKVEGEEEEEEEEDRWRFRMISDKAEEGEVIQVHPAYEYVDDPKSQFRLASYSKQTLTFFNFHKMKTKNFVLLLVCFTVSSLLFWLLSNPAPNFKTIVTETHKQINNLNSKIQKNLGADADTEFEVDSAYLELLGFVHKPRLYQPGANDLPLSQVEARRHHAKVVDQDSNQRAANNRKYPVGNEGLASNKSFLPVVVTAVASASVSQAMNFIKSMQRHFPDKTLVLYDLGLSSRDVLTLKKACNCSIRVFEFDKYPTHVSNLKLKAYRPIIIQEMLNEFTAVFWSDLNKQFITGNVSHLVARAEREGILAWRLDLPISALTHPKMFPFFQTDRNQFLFVHMVDTNQLIIFNHRAVHERVMLPWVKCTLTEECISPPGAQLGGCNFDRKPYFRYSGCHRYDSSALNIILGLHYDFDDKRYSCSDSVFGTESFDSEADSPADDATTTNQTFHR